MRGLRRWVAGGALAATLAATAALEAKEPAAQKAPRPGDKGLIGSWFGRRPANTGRKVPARSADKARVEAEPAACLSKTDEAAASRAVEEAAFLRRMDVCTKLREVAVQTNDVVLDRLAQQLEEQIWNVYSQRTLAARPGLEGPENGSEGETPTTAQKRPARRGPAEAEGVSGDAVIHAVAPEEKP